MSYLAKFKGAFEYPDIKTAQNALKIIDDEEENPDDFEINALTKEHFKFDEEKKTLTIDFSDFLAPSTWYGCRRVLCKMSKNAVKGQIKCGFEGDPDEWVKYGQGWA